jgi:hypothetical protein
MNIKRARIYQFVSRFSVLLMLGLATCVASSTTIPAGSGTLSFTVATVTHQCVNHLDQTVTYQVNTFTNFSYSLSGTTTPLIGTDVDEFTLGLGGNTCPNTQPPVTLYGAPGFPYTNQAVITFTPLSTSGTATVTSVIPGIIYPKYYIQSIIYDGAGNDSSNGFTNSTTDGTTTSIASSFQSGESFTYSFSTGFLGVGSTISWTSGNSSTTGNGSTVTETITDATGVTSAGPGSSGSNLINHLQDLFIVWVNPAVVVYQTGATSVGYAQGTQLQTTGDPSPGKPEIQDQVEVFAQAMMANAQGVTTVPLDALVPQVVDGQTLPGLANICAHLISGYPNSCTQGNQCGCAPSDFSPILAQDPLLNYTSTESPVSADTTPTACTTTAASSAKCRYLPVPAGTGSTVQEVELLSGPDEAGGNRPINTFTQTDSTMTTQTYSESNAYTVGSSTEQSFKFMGTGISIRNANQWTWTNSESSGKINGFANSMAVTLSSSTVDCYQDIPIFEDTIYHTFVFQQPPGNTSCP